MTLLRPKIEVSGIYPPLVFGSFSNRKKKELLSVLFLNTSENITGRTVNFTPSFHTRSLYLNEKFQLFSLGTLKI